MDDKAVQERIGALRQARARSRYRGLPSTTLPQIALRQHRSGPNPLRAALSTLTRSQLQPLPWSENGRRTNDRAARAADSPSPGTPRRPRYDNLPPTGPPPHEQETPSMPTGTVKWFNTTKGYGFIAPQDGSTVVFVHVSAIERAGLGTLREGRPLRCSPDATAGLLPRTSPEPSRRRAGPPVGRERHGSTAIRSDVSMEVFHTRAWNPPSTRPAPHRNPPYGN